MKTLLIISVIGSIFFAFSTNYSGTALVQDSDEWVVPENYINMPNPVAGDEEATDYGKDLYKKHCKSCHGSSGIGDGTKAAELETDCGDFTSEEFTEQTDGEIFYKSKEGRDEMPSFKKKIPEDEDIWSIVNYIRTMSDS